LNEKGIDPIAVIFAQILGVYFVVARCPLFRCNNIPIGPNVFIVQEGHNACIILATSIDVVDPGGILRLIALVVDVIHR
jgi:hypothetical protein